MSKELGECVSRDIELLRRLGWEDFAKTRRKGGPCGPEQHRRLPSTLPTAPLQESRSPRQACHPQMGHPETTRRAVQGSAQVMQRPLEFSQRGVRTNDPEGSMGGDARFHGPRARKNPSVPPRVSSLKETDALIGSATTHGQGSTRKHCLSPPRSRCSLDMPWSKSCARSSLQTRLTVRFC